MDGGQEASAHHFLEEDRRQLLAGLDLEGGERPDVDGEVEGLEVPASLDRMPLEGICQLWPRRYLHLRHAPQDIGDVAGLEVWANLPRGGFSCQEGGRWQGWREQVSRTTTFMMPRLISASTFPFICGCRFCSLCMPSILQCSTAQRRVLSDRDPRGQARGTPIGDTPSSLLWSWAARADAGACDEGGRRGVNAPEKGCQQRVGGQLVPLLVRDLEHLTDVSRITDLPGVVATGAGAGGMSVLPPRGWQTASP